MGNNRESRNFLEITMKSRGVRKEELDSSRKSKKLSLKQLSSQPFNINKRRIFKAI